MLIAWHTRTCTLSQVFLAVKIRSGGDRTMQIRGGSMRWSLLPQAKALLPRHARRCLFCKRQRGCISATARNHRYSIHKQLSRQTRDFEHNATQRQYSFWLLLQGSVTAYTTSPNAAKAYFGVYITAGSHVSHIHERRIMMIRQQRFSISRYSNDGL